MVCAQIYRVAKPTATVSTGGCERCSDAWVKHFSLPSRKRTPPWVRIHRRPLKPPIHPAINPKNTTQITPPNRCPHAPSRPNQLTSLLSQIAAAAVRDFKIVVPSRMNDLSKGLAGRLGGKSAAGWVARRKRLKNQSVDPKNVGAPSILVAGRVKSWSS